MEDDPLAAKLVELLFARRPDIRLRVAASAEEALSVLAAGGGRPDALVCDLSLPGMSGVDLIARLRQSPAWRAIPILAISAQPPGAASAAALAAGASMFATKALLCSDFGQWVQTVADLASANRRAA